MRWLLFLMSISQSGFAQQTDFKPAFLKWLSLSNTTVVRDFKRHMLESGVPLDAGSIQAKGKLAKCYEFPPAQVDHETVKNDCVEVDIEYLVQVDRSGRVVTIYFQGGLYIRRSTGEVLDVASSVSGVRCVDCAP